MRKAFRPCALPVSGTCTLRWMHRIGVAYRTAPENPQPWLYDGTSGPRALRRSYPQLRWINRWITRYRTDNDAEIREIGALVTK